LKIVYIALGINITRTWLSLHLYKVKADFWSRFEQALQFEMDILHEVELGRWLPALELYTNAQQAGEAILADKRCLK